MVILAESYLQTIEKQALNIAQNRNPPVNPISHLRYVDDTHDRFKRKQDSEEFQKILNEQDPRIQFTAEYENENKELNYLDITITNNKEGKYDYKVHRKNAITNIQIKPESCHDEKIKIGVVKGYLLRAESICSEKYKQQEISFIKKIFVENGYEEAELDKIIKDMEKRKTRNDSNKKKEAEKRFVSLPWIPGLSQKLQKVFKKVDCKLSFKSPRNLESILTSKNKPKLPPNSHPGVYVVPMGCKRCYTGESKKQVRTRNLEHEKAVFKGNTSVDAIAEHKDTCDCNIDWQSTKTLAVEPIWYKRKIREALEIRRLRTGPDDPRGVNRDLGDFVTTNTWSSLFDKINDMKILPTLDSLTSNNDEGVE